MFAAVSAHKYIIAFCIGVELLAAGTKRWLSLVYIFTFSFMSSLGIGIGILLVGGAGAADAGLYSVVLQVSLCCCGHFPSEVVLVVVEIFVKYFVRGAIISPPSSDAHITVFRFER